MLVLVCGLPGTGKSTIARNLASRMNAAILRTDSVRKELIEKPEYSDEEKELVYRTTLLIAKYLLSAGKSVIIDGTFYKKSLRARAYEVAEKTGSALEIIECTCPEDVIIKRMKRRKGREALSDADYEVYRKIKEEFEPIERKHVVIDTSKNLEQNLRELYEKLCL